MSTRMTKEDFPVSFGVFKPVGHVVVALSTDEVAQEMNQALLDRGLAAEDIVFFRADEMSEKLKTHIPHISGTAGFGTEIQFMRHYDELAATRHGWLIVYTADSDQEPLVQELAEQFNAKLAHKYNLLVTEELI